MTLKRHTGVKGLVHGDSEEEAAQGSEAGDQAAVRCRGDRPIVEKDTRLRQVSGQQDKSGGTEFRSQLIPTASARSGPISRTGRALIMAAVTQHGFLRAGTCRALPHGRISWPRGS